jgi:hypothetical protein
MATAKEWDTGSLVATGIGALAGAFGGGSSQKPTGYQGKVPVYQAVRQQIPMLEQDPARRPGSGGRQYFTNVQYLPKTDATGIAAAQQSARQQADEMARANLAPTQGERTQMLNMAQGMYPIYTPFIQSPASTGTTPEDNIYSELSQDAQNALSDPNWMAGDGYAQGGLLGLAQGGSTGYYLGGKTDGMADKIPATIANKQPAKLSHGEFVVPSDCVSALGSGNSEAGAKVLYDMMDRVRKHAHGTKKQIKPANLKKTLPA